MTKIYDVFYYDKDQEMIGEVLGYEADSLLTALALAGKYMANIQGNAHITEVNVEEVIEDKDEDEA
jgi:hypothetical protein